MKRPYTIGVQVIKTVEYTIDDCNSSEEAEDIASGMAAEGDFNNTTEIEQEVIVIDSYPAEKGLEEETEEEMVSA